MPAEGGEIRQPSEQLEAIAARSDDLFRIATKKQMHAVDRKLDSQFLRFDRRDTMTMQEVPVSEIDPNNLDPNLMQTESISVETPTLQRAVLMRPALDSPVHEQMSLKLVLNIRVISDKPGHDRQLELQQTEKGYALMDDEGRSVSTSEQSKLVALLQKGLPVKIQ